MPTAAPRSCRVLGCPSLVTPTQPCPTHPRPKAWAGAGRGSHAGWRILRAQVLQAHGYLCAPCRAAGRTRYAEAVDHIVPVSRGGTDARENLQPVCAPCHAAKTARERRRA